MPDQLYLLGNIVIMTAYAAIMVAIVVPVVRAGQLLTNKLAVATALIFFSCAVGHGMHALLSYRSILHGHGTSSASAWSAALWDAFTAVVGIYYWTLRRGYGVLLDKGAMYVEPGRQDRIDAAGERERLARAAAENHRATLAAVVEHTADAIIGSTPDGVITAWNAGAERLFGYPAGEAIGRHADVLTSGEGTTEQAELMARIRAGERSLSYEAQRVHKDGSPLEVAFTVAPIEDRAGTLIGISVVARDIAAAKEAAERQRAMQERTHQAQRMESLGKLAGGVAHDFNNLLAIIVNYTDFAAQQSQGDAAVRADLAHVRTAADRAINLTRQLLTFTRGDTIQPQDVDLNLAVAEVQTMLERTIGEHITLITVPSPQPLTVRADPGQVQQVLLNLALNARDAMPDGGTLVIEANTAELTGAEIDPQPRPATGRYARLLVSDTGEGMSPDVAAHVFEPFYTTKPRGQGTGLGLSTVYGILAEAGGSITLYSEAGVGTTFRVYLPLVTASGAAPSTAPRHDTPPRGDGRTVLVVEDEPALARVVTRILSNAGYHVMACANGEEALTADEQRPCDVLLTDVIMPGMSGRRLAECLHERRPGLPVLYMSGYSNGLLGTTHVLDEDIAFLEKPFTADQLLCKLHDVGTTRPDLDDAVHA
ncbi:PAS domain-containing sensor histidine kinase [Dactylosporangium siamense]|uniref:histidine kinase n=2 Tax=Dactylosporangium siamense TaxID=685454 RepID=A0A919PT78_9ACTN|nr:histidine kinase [Dactylosporangium siamense]